MAKKLHPLPPPPPALLPPPPAPSLWSRFRGWLSGLFKRKPKAPEPAPIVPIAESEREAVAKARGIYLRALGKDPTDSTGKVARLKAGADAIALEAERRRIERDAVATRVKAEAFTAAQHGSAYYLARNIWYGIPMTGEPEVIYPELTDEDALTMGEWFEYVAKHKKDGEDEMIDHLKMLIPANPGETYQAWTSRLKRQRKRWAVETDEVVVNKRLFARWKGETYVDWVRRMGSANPSGVRPNRQGQPGRAGSVHSK